MRSVPLICFFLCALISLWSIYVSASSVAVSVNGDTLNRAIRDFDAVLLMVHAPWCGHCRAAMPEFDKVFGTMREHEGTKKLRVAKINGDDHRDVGARFGVKGYPTFLLFVKGNSHPIHYNGKREHAGFVEFLYAKLSHLKAPTTRPKNATTSNRRHYEL